LHDPPPFISTGKFIWEQDIKNVDGIILSIKKDTKELRELVKSLGHGVKKEFIQIREKPTPYYLGKGKIEEIKEYVEKNNIEAVFVNDALRPSQWFNLEKYLNIPVYDRIRIILEIFADRAKRKEAQLQVKLAKLRYEKPFVRELFHRVKEGERPGFLGGGEYVVADYYEMIKKQMRRIREELKKIEKEREIRRGKRKGWGFYLVSIAGYTNAGKSSLLNYLTGEKVVVEERVFSTLSTKTSKLKVKGDVPLLFTDTVGFIKDLPHWMIDAFHSTLEEIYLADVVVLLMDASEELDEMKEKAFTSLKEIYGLKERPNIVIALNKIDLLKKEEIERKKKEMEKLLGHKCIPISAKTGENIDLLLQEIYNILPPPSKLEIKLPMNNNKEIIEWIEENTNILEWNLDGCLKIKIKCSERLKEKIIGRCRKAGGEVRVI